MASLYRSLTTRRPRGNTRNTRTDINKLLQTIGLIRVQTGELNTKIENVKTLQDQILTSHATEEEKTEQLDRLNSEITKSSIEIRSKLKGIEKSIVQQEAEELRTAKNLGKCSISETSPSESIQLVPQETGISAKLRIHKMQYATTLKLYTDTINEFTEAQIEFRNQSRSRLKRQLEIANATHYSEQQIEDMIDDGNFTVFTQGLISETQEAKRVLAHLKQRHTSLKKLEKSIELLNDLFSDVAFQVEAQAEKIDKIETQTEITVDQVDNANKELESAIEEKRKYNKRQIMLGSAAITFILVIIIVIVVICKHLKYF